MKPNIKKYTFKEGLPQEFELIGIKQLFKENSASLTTPHRTGFYHILWFQTGSSTHLVDFVSVPIRPNSILFLNKDTVQRFDEKGNFDGKAILFTDNFFCKTDSDFKYLRGNILFNDLLSTSPVSISKNKASFQQLLVLMEQELKHPKDSFQSDILKNLLHHFLHLAEREKRKQYPSEVKNGADRDYLILFKDLLEENFKTQKQVNYYAKEISVTEKRLNQATSKILGKSPKQMIDERVMLEAKRLLAHTIDSVKEIAFHIGFEEPTNFIKYFKKHSNLTPIEFRENFTKA